MFILISFIFTLCGTLDGVSRRRTQCIFHPTYCPRFKTLSRGKQMSEPEGRKRVSFFSFMFSFSYYFTLSFILQRHFKVRDVYHAIYKVNIYILWYQPGPESEIITVDCAFYFPSISSFYFHTKFSKRSLLALPYVWLIYILTKSITFSRLHHIIYS